MDAEFESLGLGPSLMRGIAAAGYTSPRPIQARTIPAVLAGRDVLGLAQTGTGKTAAFVLPLLERLGTERKPGPRVLVLAPTRELATQIDQELAKLGRFTGIRSVAIFGGVSQHSQVERLRARPDVVVACPGRLLDLMGQRLVSLERIESLVLDEADHMFDMGFLPDVRRILGALPKKRQTLLFSATMPREIRALADEQLHDPQVVEIDHERPIETVEHAIYPVADQSKTALLEHLIRHDGIASAIVFTRTKHRAKRLAQQLVRAGHRATALQGNMSQNARVRAMEGFRKRDFDILVATDIAARGIDVESVSHVVNFDMPTTTEAYTHRIGRTGRSMQSGKAYTFVTAEDAPAVRAVERRMGEALPRRTVEAVGSIPFPAHDPRASAPPQAAPRAPHRGSQRSGSRWSHGAPASTGRANGGAPSGRPRSPYRSRRSGSASSSRRAR